MGSGSLVRSPVRMCLRNKSNLKLSRRVIKVRVTATPGSKYFSEFMLDGADVSGMCLQHHLLLVTMFE